MTNRKSAGDGHMLRVVNLSKIVAEAFWPKTGKLKAALLPWLGNAEGLPDSDIALLVHYSALLKLEAIHNAGHSV